MREEEKREGGWWKRRWTFVFIIATTRIFDPVARLNDEVIRAVFTVLFSSIERREVVNEWKRSRLFIFIVAVLSRTKMNTDQQWYFLTGLSLGVVLLISPAFTADCDERAPSNAMLFATKVEESPMILIGTSLNKNMETNVRNLFNVTFLVECILKGPPTQRIIYIVQAGKKHTERKAQGLTPSVLRFSIGSSCMPTFKCQSTIYCLSRTVLRWNLSAGWFRRSPLQPTVEYRTGKDLWSFTNLSIHRSKWHRCTRNESLSNCCLRRLSNRLEHSRSSWVM